ncbi:MAG TPA: hypothetical protein VGS09_10395 [Actinomycetota bacterium]|nr:hypothetical protein [Actinomycetota bacterium]
MRCEVAERELSATLDGQADRRVERSLAEHLEGCSRCRAFQAQILRIHELARVQPAGPVPDLVPAIMAQVRRQRAPRRGAVITLPRPSPAWGRYAVAFVAGAVVAALLLGGLPLLRRGPSPALASEIPGRVAQASREVTAYRATFRIEERNFHSVVSFRRFTASVTFRAPEEFRAEVRDETLYPAGPWPRNDILLAMDRERWLVEGPVTCPREALPACPLEGRERRSVSGREPFDNDTPLPTDVVVPVRTLAGSDRVRVAGEGEILGQAVVVIELPYRDATPLFAYLQATGSWRPFYPLDLVRVSLDAETWFPLAYEVWPSSAPERRLWAIRNGLPPERRGAPVFTAEALSFEESIPTGWTPRAETKASAIDQGFRDVPYAPLTRTALALPTDLSGLRPYRAGTFALGGRPRDEVLVSYTKGLTWLKILQTREWRRSQLFGNIGPLAAPVRLPGKGVAYYEPATSSLGRRISIHAVGLDMYLESNLPQDELLRVAGSLPVRGEPVPRAWLVRRWPGGVIREQVSLGQAALEAPYLLLPRRLPAGFRPWVAQLSREGGRTSVTVYFRRPGTELDGMGIRLHQAPRTPLPPPMDPDVLAVEVRGTIGRYSPVRGELEWVERGIYYSLGGTALDLAGLLQVAASLEPAG